MVCQIEGLDSVIKSRGAEVGSTRGVSQGTRVDCRCWSIIVDVSGKGGLLSILAMSVSLLGLVSI